MSIMVPTSFDGENTVLDKPADLTADQCDALSVLRIVSDEGFPLVISCWKLTQEELEEVQRTGRVWLTVYGTTMPQVALSAERPFQLVPGA